MSMQFIIDGCIQINTIQLEDTVLGTRSPKGIQRRLPAPFQQSVSRSEVVAVD